MEFSPRSPVWVGARLWAFCFQFFVAEQIARLGWPGHYSMMRNWISDLGSGRSPLHRVMNGSFVLQGLLISLGAVLVHRVFPARWIYWVALVLLMISGVGVMVVGLVPEDADAPMHRLGALIHLLGGNLAMILVGVMTLIGAASRPFRMRATGWITLAAGSAGLLALLALGLSGLSALSTEGQIAGAVERLAAYPLPLWLTWTGLTILGMRETSE